MADARDLKSREPQNSCGFESHHRHHCFVGLSIDGIDVRLSEESRTRLNYPEDQPLTFGFLETPCPELETDIYSAPPRRLISKVLEGQGLDVLRPRFRTFIPQRKGGGTWNRVFHPIRCLKIANGRTAAGVLPIDGSSSATGVPIYRSIRKPDKKQTAPRVARGGCSA
jgi:hypothetical protein